MAAIFGSILFLRLLNYSRMKFLARLRRKNAFANRCPFSRDRKQNFRNAERRLMKYQRSPGACSERNLILQGPLIGACLVVFNITCRLLHGTVKFFGEVRRTFRILKQFCRNCYCFAREISLTSWGKFRSRLINYILHVPVTLLLITFAVNSLTSEFLPGAIINSFSSLKDLLAVIQSRCIHTT